MCRQCTEAKSKLEKEKFNMERVREKYDYAWGRYSEAYYEHRSKELSCNI